MTKLSISDLQTSQTYELAEKECEAIVGGGVLDTIGQVADVGSKVVNFVGGIFGGGEKKPIKLRDAIAQIDNDFIRKISYRSAERDGRLDTIVYK